MRYVCHICGGTGCTYNMKTCCRCKIMTVHMYCFESISFPVPETWVCLDCSGGYDDCAGSCKTSDGGKRVFESAKVKFLSAEEAISLTSGAKAISLTSGARSWATKRARFSILPGMKEKAAKRHSNLCLMPKPPLRANTLATDAGIRALLPKFSRPPPHLTRHGPATGGLKPKVVQSAGKTIDSGIHSSSEDNITLLDDAHKESNTEDMGIKPLGYSVPCHTDGERCQGQLRLLMNPQVQYENEPVPEVCWRGMFGAFNADFRVECEMQAHFAQSILSKVYEFSKQIPKNLEFKIVRRLHAWPKIFLDEPPASGDVGLYFLPTEVTRSREMYSTLLEYLDLKDFALCCSLGNVELLVYTSAQLPAHSRGSVSRAFLFAVFRHLKKKKVSHPIKKELAADTHLSSGNQLAISLERRSNEAHGVCFSGNQLAISLQRRSNEAHGMDRRTLNIPDDILDVPPGFENSMPQSNYGKRLDLLSPFGKALDVQQDYTSPSVSRIVSVKEECEGSSTKLLDNTNTLPSFKFVTVKTERES